MVRIYPPALYAIVVIVVTFAIGSAIIGYNSRGTAQYAVAMTTLVLCEFCIASVVVRRLYRLQRFLKEQDYAICVRCKYSLRGLVQRGACPECGATYELADTQRTWRDWFHADTNRRLNSRRQSALLWVGAAILVSFIISDVTASRYPGLYAYRGVIGGLICAPMCAFAMMLGRRER
ncbi:MAG: hypothetical protein CHACPFDD_02801 [Phycisphaerae bacterium]|nr:hypothetical protein [Phycisphaerae bacterium]